MSEGRSDADFVCLIPRLDIGRAALEENRLLILELRNCDGDLAAEKLWLPHVTPGGILDRLIRELSVEENVKA